MDKMIQRMENNNRDCESFLVNIRFFVPFKVVVSPITLRWLYHLSVYGGCIVHLLKVVKVVVSPIRHLITHQFYLRMLNTMFISKLH